MAAANTPENSENEKLKALLDMLLVSGADVHPGPKRYLYNPLFPQEAITLVAGDPGVGKSKLMSAIAAAVSRGEPICGYECKAPGKVLYITQEESKDDIVTTFDASGGALDKLTVLSEQEKALDWFQEHGLTFGSPIVEAMVKREAPTLVVFDPLQRFMSSKADPNSIVSSNQEIQPLQKLAKKYSCSIVLVAHNGKDPRGKSLAGRVNGSVNIVGQCRSALSVVADPENTDINLILHSKSNNKKGRTLQYAVESIPGNEDFARIRWIGATDYTEQDYARAKARADRAQLEIGIADDDPLVQTVVKLAADNPKGAKIARDDLAVLVDEFTGQPYTRTLSDTVKKYAVYLQEKHGIEIRRKEKEALRSFVFNGELHDPSICRDRFLLVRHI